MGCTIAAVSAQWGQWNITYRKSTTEGAPQSVCYLSKNTHQKSTFHSLQDSESEWKDHPIEDGGDSMKSYPHSAFRDKRSSAFYATAVTLAMLGALAFVYRRILCGSVLALVNQMRAGKR